MRIKIAYKLLIVNLTIILILVLSMQVINYLSNEKVLNSFVSDLESKMLDDIANNMVTEYVKNQNWNAIIVNPMTWRNFTFTQLKKYDPFFKEFSTDKHWSEKRPPPPKPFKHNNGFMPPPFDFERKKPPMHIDHFIDRINLLDAKKNPLILSSTVAEPMLNRKIELNNITIGWLTLNKKERKNNSITNYYLSKQLEMNYWIGALGVCIATLFSYFLSRHITAPINLLNKGAQKIAKRDFTTHIAITTNDEFKDLAHSVNNISKELSKYDIRQKQWIMDISHELRTPLTILDGELEAISDGLIALDNKAIQSLQEEVTLIMRLVNDLHQLSIFDKANFECKKDTIDLAQLLNNQVSRFNNQFTAKNINLINKLSKSGVEIKGDYDRLSQVIQNIFENGLRYIDSPGQLIIRASFTHELIHLNFEDSGPGVTKEALPLLFNRLYRTDESRNRKTGGAGLGLAICKNIIHAHGGNIFATLNDNGGLSINIDLPIKG